MNFTKDTEAICLKARDTEKTTAATRARTTEILAENVITKIIAARIAIGAEEIADLVVHMTRAETLAVRAEKIAHARRVLAETFGSG